jgi:hypothetical protein
MRLEWEQHRWVLIGAGLGAPVLLALIIVLANAGARGSASPASTPPRYEWSGAGALQLPNERMEGLIPETLPYPVVGTVYRASDVLSGTPPDTRVELHEQIVEEEITRLLSSVP